MEDQYVQELGCCVNIGNPRGFLGTRRHCDALGLINRTKEELCPWEMACVEGSAPASRE
jgi:hypothetical protein